MQNARGYASVWKSIKKTSHLLLTLNLLYMKDFIITDELLDNYYNEYLLNDAKFSANYGCNYNHMCLYESHLCASTTAFAP